MSPTRTASIEGEMSAAGAPDATGRRIAFLPAAVLGNGSLLVTLSARGEVERLFWPHVDGPQHLGELRLGICPNGKTHWLDEEPFSWEQSYEPDTSILRTVAVGGGQRVEIVDLVHPDDPVLVRRVRCDEETRFVALCCPVLSEAHFYGAAYVDPESGALVFYRRGVAIALWSSRADEHAVGRTRRERAYSVVDDACDGRLEGDTVAHRQPLEGAIAGALADEATIVVAFGTSPAEALALVRTHGLRAEESEQERRAYDWTRITSAEPPVAGPAGLEQLYRRSLLVLEELADRSTGGVIAAPELDPTFLHSGGYGFVWPRDLAFIALGLLAAGGRQELVASSLRWLARHQAPEGLWLQRHWTDGTLAPAWSLHQLDETGTAMFAVEAAWRELEDEALDRELWPAVRRGADFLCAFRDRQTGLPLASVDLWEQHDAQHTYTAAATVGGLRAAAAMAARHEPALVVAYASAADGIAAAIDAHLWSAEHGRHLRCRQLGRPDLAGTPPGAAFERDLPYPNRAVHSVDAIDARLDSSLLGLGWPFRVLPPDSPRLTSTVAAVASGLTAPDGGVFRHAGDTYAGGNPWPVSTLWLGLTQRLLGDDGGYRRAVDYVVSRRTDLDLLPEQVLPDGAPGWVLPLAWSHAMLLLAARPELAIVRGSPVATSAR